MGRGLGDQQAAASFCCFPCQARNHSQHHTPKRLRPPQPMLFVSLSLGQSLPPPPPPVSYSFTRCVAHEQGGGQQKQGVGACET